MNREELAWAAGFFDGEGWVGLSGRGKQLSIRVVQVDRRVLDRFAAALGLGRVTGPRTRRNPKWRPMYVYQVGGFPITQAIMAMLWRWMSPVKREQFAKASSTVLPRLGRWHRHQTTCSRGHFLSGDNLGRRHGERVCRACMRGHQAAYIRRRSPERAAAHALAIRQWQRRFRQTETGKQYRRDQERKRRLRRKTAHALLVAI